jgi:hypothetical protein
MQLKELKRMGGRLYAGRLADHEFGWQLDELMRQGLGKSGRAADLRVKILGARTIYDEVNRLPAPEREVVCAEAGRKFSDDVAETLRMMAYRVK